MSPMEIRILLRRLELLRLAVERPGPHADRVPCGESSSALRAADVAELRRRADQRGARWA
jgi:hypothetical protein